MSPEQCRGSGEVDHRTDVYALGCILFEMLCGRPPFQHEGFGELIQAHLSVVPPTIRSCDPALPPSADALVARMLAKSPDDRPQTMRALIGELEAVISSEPAMTAVLEADAAPPASPAEAPKVQTTLRFASAEKLPGESIGESPAPRTKRRPTRALAATAFVGVITVVISGFAIWRQARHPTLAPAGDEGSPAAVVSVPAGAVEAVAPPAAPAPPAVPRVPTTPSEAENIPAAAVLSGDRQRTPPAPSPVPAPGGSIAAPPAARTVKVVIASQPPGADLCLQKDRILLGKTRFEWHAPRSSREARLLIRKRGYRGQELAVATDRDSKRLVTLEKLGPDDIDDIDNCRRP
jgi:serine/threonine-protein kinase